MNMTPEQGPDLTARIAAALDAIDPADMAEAMLNQAAIDAENKQAGE